MKTNAHRNGVSRRNVLGSVLGGIVMILLGTCVALAGARTQDVQIAMAGFTAIAVGTGFIALGCPFLKFLLRVTEHVSDDPDPPGTLRPIGTTDQSIESRSTLSAVPDRTGESTRFVPISGRNTGTANIKR